jgi:tRNA A37 threonylcarbamoyltransferase TsaD
MVRSMAKDRGARFFVPPRDVCVDNGAMIAWLGFLMYRSGVRMSLAESVINQRFRTDMVEVTWRG